VLGHVDVKLGMIMVIGTVIGVEAGAQFIEYLQRLGQTEQVIGWVYVVIMIGIGTFTLIESLRATRMIDTERMSAKEAMGFSGFADSVHGLRIPPMVTFQVSGVTMSVWNVVLVGFITGVLAGSLGVGGGFIRMPLLVYVLGLPTHVAIGTDLFEIVISAGFGTLTHALKGNVDILMALVMQTGAAIGAQIGAVSTRFFAGPRIRLFFSLLPFIAAILVIIRLMGGGAGPHI
jgi:uncharacterized membrane protein YfcA